MKSILDNNKCEYCNVPSIYKVSSFHPIIVDVSKQEHYLPIPGNVEMRISYRCNNCINKKESYINKYCYVFVEKV